MKTSSETEIIIDPELSIYPNPTLGKLNIQSDINLGASQVTISNQLGAVVLNLQIEINSDVVTSLNVESLSPGLYICTIVSNGERIIKKFIKN